MKTYIGETNGRDWSVTVIEDGERRPLDPRLDLRRHSPDGFSWGYLGSGPSQLALALAANATGDDRRAIRVYQRLKEAVIARFNINCGWGPIAAHDIVDVIDRIEALAEERGEAVDG